MTIEQLAAIIAGILAAFELIESIRAGKPSLLALAVLILAVVFAFDLKV